MADKIIRVLAKDAPVKASAITAKEMVERSRQIHKTPARGHRRPGAAA